MRKLFIFFVFLSVIIVLLTESCVRQSSFSVGTKVICDAEKVDETGDNFIAENDSSYTFKGGALQSSIVSYNGEFSAMTIGGKSAFAFTNLISNVGPDTYFRVCVWRKTKDDNGVLVATSDKNSADFYIVANDPVIMDSTGWEQLVLDVYTPPDFGINGLKIYVWNNGKDTVFFDNFSIERLSSKVYPEYNYKEGLNLVFDTIDIIKINRKRKEAFGDGVLQIDDNDWIKGIVVDNDIAKKAKMRLKGDWLDHLWGNKWSYRVKMRKGNTFNRMKVFSLQTPAARGFLNEWVAHELFRENDVLTTRYNFVTLSVNNSSRGLYAWEEHFVKQLPEWNSRREGPIVKFSEDAFWQVQKYSIFKGTWYSFPYFEAGKIVPFGENKTVNNSALFKQFKNADILMNQYRQNLKRPSEIFDIDKLAAYYAILDLSHARHGQTWHNQRFYYNPVICKLEPIAYDAYTENMEEHLDISVNDIIFYKVYSQNDESNANFDNLVYRLFKDSLFVSKYFNYIEKFTDPVFIDTFYEDIEQQIVYLDSLLRMEFPNYYFDNELLSKSAAEIRSFLPQLKDLFMSNNYGADIILIDRSENYSDSSAFEDTPEYFVNVYTERSENDSLQLDIRNYFPARIEVVGTGYEKEFITSFFPKPLSVKGYREGYDGVKRIVTADTLANYLFFYIKGSDDTYSVPVLKWPYPEGETPQQKIMKLVDMNNPVFAKVQSGQIDFRNGDIVIDKPLIIPEGYMVNIYAGTKIDIIDSALILSYSPLNIVGTLDNPVEIISSDYTANGITVLQAEGVSTVKNVRFKNLNTLNYHGWTLTGSVTFYESDVIIDNALFYRNQCEDALNTVRSAFELRNSSFEYTFGDAYDADFCTGTVYGCSFENIGNDAIDFSGSEISIVETTINIASDKGISGGEDSKVMVDNVKISRCNIGLASKDLSRVVVSGSDVSECNYGIVLLQKKPEYGPSFMELKDTKLSDLKVVDLVEINSMAIINNDTIIGEKENLSEIFY